MSRLVVMLLVAAVAACGSSDPCDGQDGACLSIELDGTIPPIDSIHFTLANAGVTSEFDRPMPAGTSSLPVAIRVTLPSAASGTLSVGALATMGGAQVAIDKADVAITAGGHAHVALKMDPLDAVCPEIDGANRTDALVVAQVINRTSGPQLENSFRLALLDEISQFVPIQFVVCDTKGSNDNAVHAVQIAATKYHASAVLGPNSSGGVVKVAPDLVMYDVLAISPSSTAIGVASLTANSASGERLVWRTAPSDTLQAAKLASLMANEMPVPTKIDSMFVANVYGMGLHDGFVGAATMLGLPVNAAVQRGFMPGTAPMNGMPGMPDPSLGTALSALDADSPSDALLIADTDAQALVGMLASQGGLAQTHFFMTDTAHTPSIFGDPSSPVPASVLSRIKGTVASAPVTSATYKVFQGAYVAKYGQDPAAFPFAANAYDAAYLVAIAASAKMGALPTGSDLAAALGTLRPSGATIQVGSGSFEQAVAAMRAGTLRLQGASGPLDFDKNGDLVSGSFDVWAIDSSTTPPHFVVVPQ